MSYKNGKSEEILCFEVLGVLVIKALVLDSDPHLNQCGSGTIVYLDPH
jgi:hypothetical protein